MELRGSHSACGACTELMSAAWTPECLRSEETRQHTHVPGSSVRPSCSTGRWAQQAALSSARARQDPSRTRQSLLTLATFRSWGIHWMTPHEGPSERLPDPVPGCEPAPTDSTRPCLSSRTHPRARGLSWEVRPRAPRCVHTGTDAAKPALRDRSHRPGLAPEMGGPIYSFLVARGCRRVERPEDSPSGLWRTLGKRVGCKPSGVRIPHPPPPPRNLRDSGVLCFSPTDTTLERAVGRAADRYLPTQQVLVPHLVERASTSFVSS